MDNLHKKFDEIVATEMAIEDMHDDWENMISKMN